MVRRQVFAAVLLAFVALAAASRPNCLQSGQKYLNLCIRGLNSADPCGVLMCEYAKASVAIGCDFEYFDAVGRRLCAAKGQTSVFTAPEVPIAKSAQTVNKECATQCKFLGNKCTALDCVRQCIEKSFENFEGETCENGKTVECETQQDSEALLLVKRQMRSLIRKW